MFADAIPRRRQESEGLVVGMELEDAQAPPRVGPLWIFEGRYTSGREFRGGRQHGVAMEAPTAVGMVTLIAAVYEG